MNRLRASPALLTAAAAACFGTLAAGVAGSNAAVATTPPLSTWTATSVPLPAGSQPGDARIAPSQNGTALVDWSVEPTKTGGGKYRSGIGVLRADGTLSGASVVPWTISSAPVVDGSGGGTVLASDFAIGTYEHRHLGWAPVAADGSVGKRRQLATRPLVSGEDPALAGNAAGGAVAAWIEQAKNGAFIVRAATRAPGKGFARPKTLGTLIEAEAVTAAVDGDGDVVVAYGGATGPRAAATRHLYAWTGTATGGLNRKLIAGPQGGSHTHTAATFTSKGSAQVAWSTQTGGEEAGSALVVRVATLASGGTAFSKPQVLDPGKAKDFPRGGLQIVAGPQGTSTVAWNAVKRSQVYPVKVAKGDQSGRFAAAQQLAASGVLGGVSVDADGAAAVSWAPIVDDAGEAVVVAYRAASAPRFGVAEPVGGLAVDEQYYGEPLGLLKPAPAFFGTPRRPTVVQVTGAAGQTPTLRVATRPAS
jgi:hypothetical protein